MTLRPGAMAAALRGAPRRSVASSPQRYVPRSVFPSAPRMRITQVLKVSSMPPVEIAPATAAAL